MARTTKYDYRKDPFTEVDQAISVDVEGLTIPSESPFYVQLEEVPRLNDPSTVAIYNVTDALTMQEVSAEPAAQEYQVDYPTPLGENPSLARYGTGKIRFNSAQGNKHIHVTYKGTGNLVRASIINDLQDDDKSNSGSGVGSVAVSANYAACATVTLNTIAGQKVVINAAGEARIISGTGYHNGNFALFRDAVEILTGDAFNLTVGGITRILKVLPFVDGGAGTGATVYTLKVKGTGADGPPSVTGYGWMNAHSHFPID